MINQSAGPFRQPYPPREEGVAGESTQPHPKAAVSLRLAPFVHSARAERPEY